MTMRTSLLMLAASAAPLFAQQPSASPEPVAQPFTSMAAPAAPAPVTPEQRAGVFSALALLPQDISSFYVLTDIGGNMRRLAQRGSFPELRVEDLPAEILALDNLAFATGMATPATCDFMSMLVECFRTRDVAEEFASCWKAEARADLADTIAQALKEGAMAAANRKISPAQPLRIPTGYVVLTVKPGQEQLLQELFTCYLSQLQDVQEEWISPVTNENGFSGIRMDLGKKHEADRAAGVIIDHAEEQAFADELARHRFCLLMRHQGNALIIAACEDPQELKLPEAPAESLLGTGMLGDADSRLDKGMVMAAHLSKEASTLCQEFNNHYLGNIAEGIRSVFARLAEVDAPNKPAYDKAAAATEALHSALFSFMRPISRPTDCLAWCDGDLHFTLSADAQGFSYSPGKLRLAGMAQASGTALYAETTPILPGTELPSAAAMAEAMLDLAKGISPTLNETGKRQADQLLGTLTALMPELRAAADAGATITSGLDGHFALVLDSAHGPVPPFAGVPHPTEADIPRLSLYAGVANRSQLATGWEAMKSAVNSALVKLGSAPDALSMLPFVPTQTGEAMSYHLALPFFTPDTTPALAVSDKGLAIGTSMNLNQQLLNSATGTTDFAGAVICFRLSPLARSLRSLATALDPAPEVAKPVAESKVRLEHTHQPAVLEEDEDEASAEGSGTPPAEAAELKKTADELSHAAAALEQAASVAESLYARSTIDNGTHRVQVDVKLK